MLWLGQHSGFLYTDWDLSCSKLGPGAAETGLGTQFAAGVFLGLQEVRVSDVSQWFPRMPGVQPGLVARALGWDPVLGAEGWRGAG